MEKVKVSYFTEEGLAKLKKELEYMRSVKRPEISKQIAEARDKGDLSENAEYDAAKEAQGMLEAQIAKMELKVANARIIDKSKIDSSKITILSHVTLKNKKSGAKMKYQIVPENEANLKQGKISISTPIAKGLIGKKVGDEAQIMVPNGTMNFEILNVEI